MKKLILRISVPLLLVAAGWGVYRFYKQFEQENDQIATTKVLRSDVIIRSYSRGELRSVRSAMLVAPNLFGTVQITRLAPLGALAREKDLVVEFDDSEVRSRLDEKQLEVDQIQEQIKQKQAELEIRSNQDEVELLSARYSVRRSELEVKRNELLSAINAKTNLLNLEEARRRFKQLESDVKSRREQARAELAVLQEKKAKSELELTRERQRLSQVKLLAPMTGLVAVRQARPMGFFYRGMQLPDLREGDQVYPGTPVADILDLSELEVAAKVGELDRANLHEGQDVVIRLDAVAEKQFHGKIKNLSGTASANIWSGDPAKKFDVTFSVDMQQLLTGLGAKPDQIEKMMAMARNNRNKGPQPMGGPPPGMQIRRVSAAPEGAGQNAGEQGGRRQRGPAAAPGGAPPSPGGPGSPPMFGFGGQKFTAKELEEAELPLPPEKDNQLEVLLRPGLLADVEIIVEKVPNALHVPAQAVFDKDGKPIVFVKQGSRFEERFIKPLKRSESVMVLSEGVQPGEVVALTDPRKGAKKGKSESKKTTLPMGGSGQGGKQ